MIEEETAAVPTITEPSDIPRQRSLVVEEDAADSEVVSLALKMEVWTPSWPTAKLQAEGFKSGRGLGVFNCEIVKCEV